LVGDGHVIQI